MPDFASKTGFSLTWKIVLAAAVLILELGNLIGLAWAEWFGPAAVHWAELILITPIAGWIGLQVFEKFRTCMAAPHRLLGASIALLTAVTYSYAAVSAVLPWLFPDALKGPHGPDVYFEATGVFAILVLSVVFFDRFVPMQAGQTYPDTNPGELRPDTPGISVTGRRHENAEMTVNLSDDHPPLKERLLEAMCIALGLVLFAAALYLVWFVAFDPPWWIRFAF